MMPTLEANPPTQISITASTSKRSIHNDHASQSAIAIRMQRAAIIAHCSDMTRRLGRRVSLDEAAREWIPIYAEIWRRNFEKQTIARSFGICPSDAVSGNA